MSYKILSHKGTIKVVSNQKINVPKQGLAEGTLFIELNAAILEGEKMKLKIGVFSGDELIETTKTVFLGPRSYR